MEMPLDSTLEGRWISLESVDKYLLNPVNYMKTNFSESYYKSSCSSAINGISELPLLGNGVGTSSFRLFLFAY